MGGDDDREGLSRRRLLDVFGRGLRRLHEDLGRESGAAPEIPVSRSPVPTAPAGTYSRITRPSDEFATAVPVMPGTWQVDLHGRRLGVGTSRIVRGEELTENVVLVRVHTTHLAACTAECPVDGSDLEWDESLDRLICPGCQSLWRLDGEPTAGPAASRLGTLLVEAYVDDAQDLEIRLQTP